MKSLGFKKLFLSDKNIKVFKYNTSERTEYIHESTTAELDIIKKVLKNITNKDNITNSFLVDTFGWLANGNFFMYVKVGTKA